MKHLIRGKWLYFNIHKFKSTGYFELQKQSLQVYAKLVTFCQHTVTFSIQERFLKIYLFVYDIIYIQESLFQGMSLTLAM